MDIKYNKAKKQIEVTIPYDESVDYPLHAHGKNRVVGSSGGFVLLQDAAHGTKISVHVFNKKDVPKA